MLAVLFTARPVLAQEEICVDEAGTFAPTWQKLKVYPVNYSCKSDKDCAIIVAGCDSISVNNKMEPAMRKAAMCVNMAVECMPPIAGTKEIPVCIKNHCEIKIKHTTSSDTSTTLPDDLFETSNPATAGTIEELTQP